MGASRGGQDVERGGGGVRDEIEAVPSLDEITSESSSNAHSNVAITSNMEESTQLGNASNSSSVSNRITALIYMWQQHVLSQTNNPQARFVVERLVVLIIFLKYMMEVPINYFLGDSGQQQSSGTPNTPRIPSKPRVSRGFVKTPLGTIGYLYAQDRKPRHTPIICFHSSPRNSDEFLEILPILAETGRKVIAVDLPGYGASENPYKSCNFHDIADAMITLADDLSIDKFITIGSFIGNYISISLASRYPHRVIACIHSNLLDNSSPTQSDSKKQQPPKSEMDDRKSPNDTDTFQLYEDGSHLLKLHNKRKWLDPELNFRVVQGEITYLINAQKRQDKNIIIQDVKEFDLDVAFRRISCPILCIKGEMAFSYLDHQGENAAQRFNTAYRLLKHSNQDCDIRELTGPNSTIDMINQAPNDFVTLCSEFLDKNKI